MAAEAIGIFNHLAAGQTLKSATPAETAKSADTRSNSTAASSTISANDFLTLLVTEMKNQDPTANTDPNEYINQLVQVNSLEQLISINQTLTADSTTPSGDAVAHGSLASAVPDQGITPAASLHAPASTPSTMSRAIHAATAKHVSGNLSVPAVAPAAQRVAQALGGRPHATSVVPTR
jgi:flagellar basal-body rod modification protein FlgD